MYRESDLQLALRRQKELSKELERDRMIRLALVAERRGRASQTYQGRAGRSQVRLANVVKASLALALSLILAVIILVSQAG